MFGSDEGMCCCFMLTSSYIFSMLSLPNQRTCRDLCSERQRVAMSCFHMPIGRCRCWEEALAAEHDKVRVTASSAVVGTHPN